MITAWGGASQERGAVRGKSGPAQLAFAFLCIFSLGTKWAPKSARRGPDFIKSHGRSQGFVSLGGSPSRIYPNCQQDHMGEGARRRSNGGSTSGKKGAHPFIFQRGTSRPRSLGGTKKGVHSLKLSKKPGAGGKLYHTKRRAGKEKESGRNKAPMQS